MYSKIILNRLKDLSIKSKKIDFMLLINYFYVLLLFLLQILLIQVTNKSITSKHYLKQKK